LESVKRAVEVAVAVAASVKAGRLGMVLKAYQWQVWREEEREGMEWKEGMERCRREMGMGKILHFLFLGKTQSTMFFLGFR
jgi:hypothetical protein